MHGHVAYVAHIHAGDWSLFKLVTHPRLYFNFNSLRKQLHSYNSINKTSRKVNELLFSIVAWCIEYCIVNIA